MTIKLDRLKQAIDTVSEQRNILKIGNELLEVIKRRIKLGRGVDKPLGKSKKLKPLATGYKKQRKQLKKKGILSSDTTAARSNFHKTGDTVDSLKVNVSGGQLKIEAESRNDKKIKDQIKQGRVILNLSKNEFKDLVDIIGNEIKKQLKG